MKRISKQIAFLLVVLVCLAAMTFGVSAAEVDGGSCGNDVTWSLDDTGVLTISGKDKMRDCDKTDAPWLIYADQVTTIVIEPGVTYLGKEAFRGMTAVTSISIPDTVISCGQYTFSDCTALTEAVVPGSLTQMPNRMFENCTALKNFVLEEGVESISLNCFRGCTALTTLSFPESLTTIEGFAFSDCDGLETVTIPGTVKTISAYVFEKCDKLQSVVLEEGVQVVEGYTFSYCPALTSVTIPEGVTKLGTGLFYGSTALKSVTIPSTVTKIYESMFEGCTALESACLHDKIESIDGFAYRNCPALTEVTIPKSVTSFGLAPFWDCANLKNIYVEAENESFCDIDGVVFTKDGAALSIFPAGRTGSYRIPEQTESIAIVAFISSQLSRLYVPETLKQIDAAAFGSTYLEEIYFEGDAPVFDNQIFGATPEITVYYPEGNATWDDYLTLEYEGTVVTWIPYTEGEISGICGEDVSWCFEVESGTLTISGSGEMENYEAEQAPWYPMREQITAVVVEPGVISVGDYAFYNCPNLTSVTLPGDQNADEQAVEEAAQMQSDSTNAVMYSGQRSSGQMAVAASNEQVASVDFFRIGHYAFCECTALTAISIPATVTEIGDSAFAQCENLEQVRFEGSQKQWEAIDMGEGNKILTETKPEFAVNPEEPVKPIQPVKPTWKNWFEMIWGNFWGNGNLPGNPPSTEPSRPSCWFDIIFGWWF